MSKIIRFQFTEVVVPARNGSINSIGFKKPLHMLPVIKSAKDAWAVQFDELPKLILELHLDNGVIGLGEFYRDHNWEIIKNTAKALLNKDITQMPLKKLPIGFFREYDGFECAIWDAFAKTKNMRLVDLLGGQLQEKIKVGAWSSFRNLTEMGDLAAKFQAEGYDSLKLKCNLFDEVIDWAEEIKKKAPKIQIIFDPNQRWENFGETKRIVRELEKVNNVFGLEDPFPFWMVKEYNQLKRFTALRIIRHISLPYIYQGQREHHLISFLNESAADGFNFNGGLAGFMRLEQTAAMANLYCWHGSEVDLGILEAMYLHSIAASTHCIWPSDILGRLVRSHDLLKNPLTIQPPYAFLSEGPGLGIDLDVDAINNYQVKKEIID